MNWEYRILVSPLLAEAGEGIIVNSVPFVRHVQVDCYARSDKTWRRFRAWALHFYQYLATRIERSAVAGEEALRLLDMVEAVKGWTEPTHDMRGAVRHERKKVTVTKFYLFNQLIAVELSLLGHFIQLAAEFEILYRGEALFWGRYQGPSGDKVWVTGPRERFPEDWHVIAELSGNSAARTARIAVASSHGHMVGHMAGRVIRPFCDSKILAFVREDFEPAKRGGYIVKNRGKFVLTKENTPGFYKVYRETERVRFSRLVEPYRIEDCSPSSP